MSAVSAVVLWWALMRGLILGVGPASWGPALGFLVLLLLPAGSAWVLGLTLNDILTLPETLRKSATVAASASRGALRGEADTKRGRLLGVIGALWAARGFVLESRGAWAKAATAARVVRLARLPFVLGLVAFFALNGVVIAAGLLALVLLLV